MSSKPQQPGQLAHISHFRSRHGAPQTLDVTLPHLDYALVVSPGGLRSRALTGRVPESQPVFDCESPSGRALVPGSRARLRTDPVDNQSIRSRITYFATFDAYHETEIATPLGIIDLITTFRYDGAYRYHLCSAAKGGTKAT
ncbi:hypothetical protein TGAM01_v207007 [Trichoderma gamsii]|uniref:Uncharacterized protein n=1 Tax=Trichoderma gamsii TaxID=398673 RepID=A0A2P4ZI77_9HYPO|nr:hypothetical protein TGAM01_v207007 [Trichoderma gamsii]PON23996.1 hypothetical protein TGAM01_v207007 [Trichoderma gamsii]